MNSREPFDALLDSAPSMDIDALAARLRELGRGDNVLLENAFHVAGVLAPGRQAMLVSALNLSDTQRARLEGMLERMSGVGQADSSTSMAPERSRDEHWPRFGRGAMIDDRYEIRALLGEGGMGVVYEAHDTRLGRRVAIKLLTASAGSELASRFVREARTTAQCKHENIVEIYDVGEHKDNPDEPAGRPFMVLEYLDGETLRRRLAGVAPTERVVDEAPRHGQPPARQRAPALTPRQALDIIIPVVRALVWAHRHDIVHRDLKPENIFLTRSGAIKVLDFGIAKALVRAGSKSVDASSVALTRDAMHTRDGVLLGTPPYMSPEQWGMGEVDQRTDLWAVGIMLYEMLRGDYPASVAPISELRAEVCDLDRPMPGIADTTSSGAGALADVIERCLRKRKSERVASARDLLAELQAVQARLEAPPSAGAWPRRPAAVLVIVVFLMALFAVTGVMHPVPPGSEPPPPAAGNAVASNASQAVQNIPPGLCGEMKELVDRDTTCEDLSESLPEGPDWANLSVGSSDVVTLVAMIERALRRARASKHGTADSDHPPARVDALGWRFAALTWSRDLLHGNEKWVDHLSAAEAIQECARETLSLADWYCTVAHFIYAATCDTCDDLKDVLERLTSQDATLFEEMATIRRPRVHCEKGDFDAAVRELVEFDNKWSEDDCRRLALTGPAMCVVLRGRASLDESALERMKQLANSRNRDCRDTPGRALAMSERAWWHYQYEENRPQAAKDWYRAWRLDSRGKAYLLNWAEARLRQRHDDTNRIPAMLKRDEFVGNQRSRAAFLRWLASWKPDDDDASILYKEYQETGEGESVLSPREVDSGVCGDEPNRDAVCHDVYELLTRSKRATEQEQLRELLFPAGEREGGEGDGIGDGRVEHGAVQPSKSDNPAR
jgi:serine/threonine protein kinase